MNLFNISFFVENDRGGLFLDWIRTTLFPSFADTRIFSSYDLFLVEQQPGVEENHLTYSLQLKSSDFLEANSYFESRLFPIIERFVSAHDNKILFFFSCMKSVEL